MANKSIFSNRGRTVSVKPFNTVNEAGGRAYALTDEAALAQYIVTGTLNGTFYATADEQVGTILEKAKNSSTDFVARAAVYARKNGKMKDTPALLAAILTTRGEEGLDALRSIFHLVIDNQKQLRNFVQIIRSGKVGRKSMGTAVKRLVQEWLRNQDADKLFYQSVGNAPSLADIVKMVHVHPANKQQEAFFGWLLDKKYNKRYLPPLVKAFEAFKNKESTEVPEVDFRMLTALDLSTSQWADIARSAGWNMIRMNLNTFERHECLKDRKLVAELSKKIADEESVRRSNAFPYQLLTTYKATLGKVPVELSNALQKAMEIATENVPVLNCEVAVCVDVSGSMNSPVTGERQGSTTVTSCVEVAGLMASTVLRKNPTAIVLPFDTMVKTGVHLNPFDSVMTNAQKLNIHGGGTACHIALDHLLVHGMKVGAVIYVSDNQSWYQNSTVRYPSGLYGAGTSMAESWARYKERNPKCKLVCIDLQPYGTAQVQDNKDVLNVGGFSDSVFDVVANFINGDSRDFVKVIRDNVEL